MAIITDGILTQKLPWTLVLMGVSIALVLELSGVPSLPFAVGVYLPLSSSTPIFVGGLIRYVADRGAASANGTAHPQSATDMSPGVLLSTGYIAGGAIGGRAGRLPLVQRHHSPIPRSHRSQSSPAALGRHSLDGLRGPGCDADRRGPRPLDGRGQYAKGCEGWGWICPVETLARQRIVIECRSSKNGYLPSV